MRVSFTRCVTIAFVTVASACSTETYIGTGHGSAGAGGSAGDEGDLASLSTPSCGFFDAVRLQTWFGTDRVDKSIARSANSARSCDDAKQQFEIQPMAVFNTSNPNWYSWGDPTPDAPQPTATVQPIEGGGPCEQNQALVLKSQGHTAYYGSGFGTWGDNFGWAPNSGDWSAWDGMALWIRRRPGAGGAFLLYANDANSVGKVLDASAGTKTCYKEGDDWDHDGKPNASVPDDLACMPRTLIVVPDDSWAFVALPWSAWGERNPTVSALGIDASRWGPLQINLGLCQDFEVEIAEIDAYRNKP